MYKKIFIVILIGIISASSTLLPGCANEYNSVEISVGEAFKNLTQKIPTDLNLPFAQTMSSYIDGELGFSLAGTQSATQTAELISSKMTQIGLTDVLKEEFACTGFSIKSAVLSYRTTAGEVVSFRLSAMPSDDIGEQRLTLVSVGNGSLNGYTNVNAYGKAVLAILDDQDENTIKYVIEQARAQGAAALITAFSHSDEQLRAAYNFDSYSVASIPVMNMTQTDANALLVAYESAVIENSAVVVTLSTDLGFTDNGIGYNIVGYIPGRDESSKIIISADYDRLFYGYNENSCSVAMLLGLAQAIKESRYIPQKTLVFVAYSGSELSERNPKNSAAKGAFIHLIQTHPEWTTGNTVHIDITMPAADHGSSYPLAVSVGLESFIGEALAGFSSSAFENGVIISNNVIGGESGYVYESAGIPTVGLDLDASEFAVKYRHTNLDDANRYNAEAFQFSYEVYAKLIISFDQTAVIPYNFLPFFTNLNNGVDLSALFNYGIDVSETKDAAYAATVQAQILNYYIKNINLAYEEAVAAKEYNRAARIYSQASYLNSIMQSFSIRINSVFFILNSHNRKQTSYEIPMEYSTKLGIAISQFEQAKVSNCIETCLTVGELKYTFLFEAIVCKIIADTANKRSFNWEAGETYFIPDIYDTLRDLYLKRNAIFSSTDFVEEIDSLKNFYNSETEKLISAFESRTVSCRLFAGEAEKLIETCEKFEIYFE